MHLLNFTRAALAALALSGCASDAWQPENSFDTFLEQVRVKCWGIRLGAVTITKLMPNANTTDTYFMDVTSRYYNGKITEQSYVAALQGAYAAQTDSPGILCILGQMPNRPIDKPPAADGE